MEPRLQVLFSVSKRRFPHAVQRNLFKRRMREAYRLQKSEILNPAPDPPTTGLAVAIQYVGKAAVDYATMHARMAEVLKKLGDHAS